uniref:Uncharacterized protein n=1 Tax=Rhipicephalus appendiculatus TaxID=34631 RepID=A0A131Y9X8_RHIAP
MESSTSLSTGLSLPRAKRNESSGTHFSLRTAPPRKKGEYVFIPRTEVCSQMTVTNQFCKSKISFTQTRNSNTLLCKYSTRLAYRAPRKRRAGFNL